MRSMTYRVFRKHYQPRESAAAHKIAGLRTEPEREDFVEYDCAKHFEPRFVWTVIEGDNGKWYISAGFHVVNRTGYYVVCEVPHDFPQRDVFYL